MAGNSTGNYGNDYLGNNLNEAARQQQVANDRYNNLVGQMQGLTDKGLGALDKASSAGDSSYGRANELLDKAAGMVRQSDENTSLMNESNKWYDQYAQGQLTGAADLMSSGKINPELESAYMDSINRGMQSSMGTMLNDLAGRGVINSSVGSQGVNRLGKQAADAYTDNYLNTFNSMLQGYQGNANQAANSGRAFADTYLNINKDLNSGAQTMANIGSQFSNMGSQQVQNQLGISQGYNNASYTNMAEREQLMRDQQGYWQNALGGTNIANDFLKQMQQDWANDTKTTVVTNEGK
jgi:hypothetical protein